MRRFFVPPQTLQGDRITLTGAPLHHLRSVLRLGTAEEIVLLDGEGTLCRCRIEQVGKESARATVLERWRESEGTLPLRLMQALPKGDKFSLVLQKGTELGITAFSPITSARCISRPAKDRGEKQLLRWRRIIQEAARQSLRPRLPRIDAPTPLAEALTTADEELRLMLWEEGSLPLDAVLPPRAPASVALLVGPEGGLSTEEAHQAAAAGFRAVRLGPRILRTETAGFAAAAVLQYIYGDLAARP